MAEDSPDDILITKRAWKTGQIKNPLHIVKNGEEAIDFIYKKGSHKEAPTPSLMLLDLKMPKMDGFEVLSQLKSEKTWKKMPIIILTTSTREQDINRAYELRARNIRANLHITFSHIAILVRTQQRMVLITIYLYLT